MLNRSYISNSEKETEKIAKEFVESFLRKRNRSVIFIEGELGSGKTTFVRYILKYLGIQESEFEGSPTFTIVNRYANNIYHIDLYRLQTSEEIEESGIYEILEKEAIILIEWPEKLKIEPDMHIKMEYIAPNTRRISFDKR